MVCSAPQPCSSIGRSAERIKSGVAEAAASVDDARVRWWELMAHLRWAVIAADQAQRHLSGEERSLCTGELRLRPAK